MSTKIVCEVGSGHTIEEAANLASGLAAEFAHSITFRYGDVEMYVSYLDKPEDIVRRWKSCRKEYNKMAFVIGFGIITVIMCAVAFYAHFGGGR